VRRVRDATVKYPKYKISTAILADMLSFMVKAKMLKPEDYDAEYRYELQDLLIRQRNAARAERSKGPAVASTPAEAQIARQPA
jgi:hypothetical protein